MNYYRHFPGDYLRDTMALSLAEDGAYRRLLDHLYSTEKPIPAREIAYKVCRISGKNERKIVDFILDSFFYYSDEGFRHKRVDEELNYAESKSQHGKKAADARWGQSPSNARALPEQSPSNAIPDSRLQTPNKDKSNTSSAPKPGAREIESPEFQIFWAAYPRKEGKKPALKVWMRLSLDSRLGEVLAGLEAWKQARDPQFMPYAQGFLNQESWKETPTVGKQDLAHVRPAGNEPKSFDAARNEGTDAALRRILERSRPQPSQAGKTSPPAIGRNGTADVHGGASRPALIEIARRVQQGTPEVEENADGPRDPRVSKRAS